MDQLLTIVERMDEELQFVRQRMLTKQDLENMATKQDLENMATKQDLEVIHRKLDIISEQVAHNTEQTGRIDELFMRLEAVETDVQLVKKIIAVK